VSARRERWAAGLLAAALLTVDVAAAACGVPTGDAPATIPASDVPYGLLSTTPSSAPATPPTPQSAQPLVFLVGGDGRLVPRGRNLSGGPLKREVAELLDDLATGPTREERRAQLSTVLPPDVRLTVTGYDSGTWTIDIVGGTDLAGRASRLAVGQIVLSATSLPGVDAVRLQRNGEPVEAPLPSGRLTTEPLTAAGYSPLTQAPPS
jgi:Sporulation and spore germination